MNYSDFRGLDPVIRLLKEGGAHAYLFLGMPGTGKKSLAGICARARNCVGALKPCDECPPCRRYLAGTHPDMIRVASDKSIGVADIREVIDRVSMRPFEGGSHTVVIENADKMTQQAQNALLKTLESPPSPVLFILIAEKPAAVLPTIVSRCRVVRFTPVSEEDAVSVLTARGLPADRARLLARLTGGAIGQAIRLDADQGYWDIRRRALDALVMLTDADRVGDAALLFKNDKDASARALDAFELHARDIMALRDAEAEPMQTDAAAELSRIRLDGARMLDAIMEARRRLQANVSWQYALEMLFFDFLGGKTA